MVSILNIVSPVFGCFVLFFIAEAIAAKSKSKNLMDVLSGSGMMNFLLFKYILGIFILSLGVAFGILSGAINPSIFLLNRSHFNVVGLVAWIIVLPITAFISFKSVKKDLANLQTSFSGKCLNKVEANRVLTIRIAFLIVYECFFRGLLLFFAISLLGIFTAVIINVMFYMLIHYFSNKKEILGTIPFGIMLCVLSIINESVWPAITIHLTLALTYEISIIKSFAINHKNKLPR